MEESRAPRVLVVEDDQDTASSIAKLLKKKFLARVEIVCDTSSARAKLAAEPFDLITLDYQLPDGDGLALLEEIALTPTAPPVIMVTGHGDEGIASDAFRFGASAYVQKDRRIADLLAEAVDKALIGARLRAAEESLQSQVGQLARQASLLDGVSDAIFTTDADFTIRSWNKGAEQMFGYPATEAIGSKSYDALDVEHNGGLSREEILVQLRETGSMNGELLVRRPGREPLVVEVTSWAGMDEDGNVNGYLAIYRDISERKNTERELERYQARLEELVGQRTEELQRADRLIGAVYRILTETGASDTLEEAGQICISVAGDLTGSKFGFIGFITPEGRLSDVSISETGWAQCNMSAPERRRLTHDMEIASYWGRVLKDGQPLLLNEPASHPDSKGVPEGHPPITSFLGVPLVQDGDTVGMIAVANKLGGFAPENLEDLQALALVFMVALDRKRFEIQLKERQASRD